MFRLQLLKLDVFAAVQLLAVTVCILELFGRIWVSPWTEETCERLFSDISNTNELQGWKR